MRAPIACVLMLGALACPQLAAADNTAATYPAGGAWTAPRSAAELTAIEPQGSMSVTYRRANFAAESASRDARYIADWVVDSRDHNALPFAIIDKLAAKVFVFDGSGKLRGASAALLGLARGDYSVPGIGERELSDMAPDDRTTPSGRFVAGMGRNAHDKDVLWVDYDTGLSMHPVISTRPEERRLKRLASPTPADNRISYGCINVPKRFFDSVVNPVFSGTEGIVYILPETRPAREEFGAYDVERRYAASKH